MCCVVWTRGENAGQRDGGSLEAEDRRPAQRSGPSTNRGGGNRPSFPLFFLSLDTLRVSNNDRFRSPSVSRNVRRKEKFELERYDSGQTRFTKRFTKGEESFSSTPVTTGFQRSRLSGCTCLPTIPLQAAIRIIRSCRWRPTEHSNPIEFLPFQVSKSAADRVVAKEDLREYRPSRSPIFFERYIYISSPFNSRAGKRQFEPHGGPSSNLGPA